jgi:hypothetical protein
VVTLRRSALDTDLRASGPRLAAQLWQHTCTNVSATFAQLFELEEAALKVEELQRLAGVEIAA